MADGRTIGAPMLAVGALSAAWATSNIMDYDAGNWASGWHYYTEIATGSLEPMALIVGLILLIGGIGLCLLADENRTPGDWSGRSNGLERIRPGW